MNILENSIWLEHPDYPGYRVSPEGQVFSLKTNQLLNQRKHINGYLVVKCAGKNRLVHRLVAMIYCDGYSKDKQVNHKSGVKTDNHFENLEWVTAKENHLHAKKVLNRYYGRGEDFSDLKESQVKEILHLRYVERWKVKDISNHFNITKACVDGICSGTRWTHIFEQCGYKKRRITSKFSEEEIKEIRRLADPLKKNYRELAAQFKTSPSMICNIYKRKIWKTI